MQLLQQNHVTFIKYVLMITRDFDKMQKIMHGLKPIVIERVSANEFNSWISNFNVTSSLKNS
jgi:hypothetical protein